MTVQKSEWEKNENSNHFPVILQFVFMICPSTSRFFLTRLGCRSFSSAIVDRPDRKFVCDFEVHHIGRHVRVEIATESDRQRLVDFLSKVAAEREPACRSTGTSANEIRPFVERIVDRGLNGQYTLMAFDRETEELIGASTATRLKIQRDRMVSARVLPDYKEVIDSLADWIPSRRARRVVGPAYDCVEIVNNFLPTDVNEVLRLDLSAVRGDFVGGSLVRKLLYEQLKMGLKDGLIWADGQTTARATQHVAKRMGFRPVFAKSYDKLYDGHERIHPRIPLLGGSTQLTLFVGRTDEIVADAKM
ncbi:hypothetical protein M3Y98_01212200 [Aphelenchoides besseyi]|nr:hypothetical protein M3Y98_01212200 [Aphelenchoides besseyi]